MGHRRWRKAQTRRSGRPVRDLGGLGGSDGLADEGGTGEGGAGEGGAYQGGEASGSEASEANDDAAEAGDTAAGQSGQASRAQLHAEREGAGVGARGGARGERGGGRVRDQPVLDLRLAAQAEEGRRGRGTSPTSGPSPQTIEAQRDQEILGEWRKHPGLGPSQIRNQLRRRGVKCR